MEALSTGYRDRGLVGFDIDQRIIRLDEVTRADGIRRCGIVLDPEVYRTEATPKRPFQGWRYLEGNVAPRDLPKDSANDDLPPKLMAALAEIGIR